MSDAIQKTLPYSGKWHEIVLENGEKKQVFMRSFWSHKSLVSFQGRVPRKYYFLGGLYASLVDIALLVCIFFFAMGLGFLVSALGVEEGSDLRNVLGKILTFALVIPYVCHVFMSTLSMMIRRCHDLGKSGWYCLFTFIPVVNIAFFLWLLFAKGDEGENKYGPETQYY